MTRKTASFAHPRRAPFLFGALFLTVALGLATRRYPQVFPGVVVRYGGDTLWAAMVFWIVAILWRRATTLQVAAAAIAISFLVEVSQLYHAAWIDGLRATRVGALALGSGFLWADLVCYCAGVCIAAAVDRTLPLSGVA